MGPSGDGELAWGSRALRACVFVFLFGHCSSKAEPRPSLGNDAAGHNRLQKPTVYGWPITVRRNYISNSEVTGESGPTQLIISSNYF